MHIKLEQDAAAGNLTLDSSYTIEHSSIPCAPPLLCGKGDLKQLILTAQRDPLRPLMRCPQTSGNGMRWKRSHRNGVRILENKLILNNNSQWDYNYKSLYVPIIKTHSQHVKKHYFENMSFWRILKQYWLGETEILGAPWKRPLKKRHQLTKSRHVDAQFTWWILWFMEHMTIVDGLHKSTSNWGASPCLFFGHVRVSWDRCGFSSAVKNIFCRFNFTIKKTVCI